MEVKYSFRDRSKHLTWIYYENGMKEVFKTVRGSIVFPFEDIPGIILIAGQRDDTGLIKVLKEIEFQNSFELPQILPDLKQRPGFYCLFYSEDEATNIFIKILKNDKSLPHFPIVGLNGTASLSYEIQMVSHYLSQNKLIVPKNGILAAQLQAGWEHFLASEKKLHGILALFWLVLGMDRGDDIFMFGGEKGLWGGG